MIKAFLYNTKDYQKNSLHLEYMGGNVEFFPVGIDIDGYFQN